MGKSNKKAKPAPKKSKPSPPRKREVLRERNVGNKGGGTTDTGPKKK